MRIGVILSLKLLSVSLLAHPQRNAACYVSICYSQSWHN